MPTYSSMCRCCGTEHEYFKKMSEALDTPMCCNVKTEKTLNAAPMIGAMTFSGYGGFESPDGKGWIEDGAQLKKYIKQNHLVSPKEGKEEAALGRKRWKVKQKEKISKAVHDARVTHSF